MVICKVRLINKQVCVGSDEQLNERSPMAPPECNLQSAPNDQLLVFRVLS